MIQIFTDKWEVLAENLVMQRKDYYKSGAGRVEREKFVRGIR